MKTRTLLLVSFFLSSLIYFSCKKEDETRSETGSSAVSKKASISGIVVDENNFPVSNVGVNAYGHHVLTNQYGIFQFKDISVDEKRCLITFINRGI